MELYQICDRSYGMSKRKMTADGYMVVPGKLARTGIYQYRADEVGFTDRDPGAIVNVYRPPEEVFSPESIKSFDGVPITIGHPKVFLNSNNWQSLSKGEVHDVKKVDDASIGGELYVRAQDAIDAIDAGTNELSNGYLCNFERRSGTTPDGQAYDAVQTHIRGNHVAIVPAGRAGRDCRIADQAAFPPLQPQPEGVPKMSEIKMMVDGMPHMVNDDAAAVIDALLKQRDEAKDAAAKAPKAEDLKAATDKVANLEKQLKDAQAKVPDEKALDALVATRTAIIADAKAMDETVATDGKTNREIARAALDTKCKADEKAKAIADSVIAGKTTETADEETLFAAFRAVSAATKDSEAKDAQTVRLTAIGDALNAQGNNATIARQTTDNKPHGYAAFVANLTDNSPKTK